MAKGTAKNKATFVMDMDANGTRKTLEQVKEDIKSTKKELKELDEILHKSGIAQDGQYAIISDKIRQKQAQLDTLQQVRKSIEQSNNDFEAILSRFNGGNQPIQQLRKDLRALQGNFKLINPDQTEKLSKYSELMGQMAFKIREAEKATKAFVMPEKELAEVISKLDTAPIEKLKLAQEELMRQMKETERGTDAWNKIVSNLSEVNKAIDDANSYSSRKQAADSAFEAFSQVNVAPIQQIKDAISYYEKLRNSVKQTSTEYDEYGSYIQRLTEYLESNKKSAEDARIGYKGLGETMNNLSGSSYDQLKRAEEDIQKVLKTGNLSEETRISFSSSLAKVRTELASREKLVADAIAKSARAAKDAEIGYEGYDKVCKNLANASLAQLKRAQEDLNEAIQKVPRNTPEYEELAGKIRMVNQATKEAGQGFTEQVSAVDKAISRLKSYVLVYLSFNKVLDLVKSKFEDWKQLADSMSDIQKRTQLNPSTVREIGEELNKIDTRTATIELYNLAATAGLLGLKSKEDIIGFTKVANEMSVALVELGEDGAAQLMKVATVTGDVKRYGVDGALTKVGSAINALTAASAASAGPIVDFVSRVGAVGVNCNVAMSEVAGLGATLDALGQPMELSATSMNKFIMAVKSNNRGIAAALGMDPDNLAALVEGGKTIEAVIQIIERMKETGTDVEEFLADAGTGEGVRIKQTINTLMNNTEMLRKQIEISNDEFRKGTSMANEYAVKNANSAAILARAYNNIQKAIINPDSEKTFRGIAIIAEGLSHVVALIAKLLPQILGYVVGVRVQMEMVGAATTKVNVLSKLWLGTLNLIKLAGKNILGGLIGTAVISGLEYVLKLIGQMKDRVGEAARSTAEWFNKLQTSIKQAKTDADMMFRALKKHISEGSTGTKEFADLVAQINSQYGQYINFTVTQTTSLEQLALAQEQVNNGIQRQMILESQRDRMSGIYANNAEEKNDAWARIEKSLTTSGRKVRTSGGDYTTGGIAKGAMPAVRDAITSSIAEVINQMQSGKIGDDNKAKGALLTETVKRFKNIGLQNGTAYANLIMNDAFKFLKKELEESNAMKDMEKTVSASLGVANDGIKKGVVKQLQGIVNEYKKLLAEPQKNADRLMELQRNFGTVSAANLDNLSKTTKTWVSQQKTMMKQHEGEVRQYAKLVSIFGFENMDPAKMSGDMLKKFSESLHKEWTRYAKNGDFKAFGEYIGQSFDSEAAANKWVHDTKEAIKARADELHITPPGGWKWDRKPRENKNKELKEEINAALAALRGYYEEQQRLEDESRIAGRITDQELANRKRMLQEMYKIDLNELYQKLLGNQSQFDEKVYGKWFDGKDLTKLQALVKKFGSTMEDGMAANAAAAAKDAREIVVQHMATIDKVLTQYDYTGQVNKKYQSQLEDIGLFWNTFTVRNREAAQRSAAEQLKMFQDLSNRIVGLDAEGLQKLIEEDDRFAEWRKKKTQKDYEALRITLLDYHDATIEAEKKQKTRMHKIVTEQMKDRSVAQHETVKQQEVFDKLMETLVNQNLVREREAGNIALSHIQQQIQYQKELISVLRGRNASTEEEEKKLTELLKAEQEKRIAIQKDAISRVKEYTDIMQSFLTDVFSAGADDDTMTKIAEVEARKRLGLAEEEEQKKYLIYSRSGKAITQMMTEEERLRWEMENNARDKRLEATSKWIGEMGKKLSDDLTAAFASKAATSAIQQGADAEVEIQRIKTEKQLEIEKTLTSAVAVEHTSRVEAAQTTADAEVMIARKKKAQIDEINGVTTGLQGGGAGVKPGDDTGNTSAIDVIAPSGFSSPYGPIAPSDNEPSLLDRNINMWQEMIDNPVTNGKDYYDTVMAKNEIMVVDTKKAFKDQELANKVANKNMAKDTAAATAQMIQAFNLYGAAYNAVMDDSMTTAQKVGMFMLQSAGQVIMQMLSLSIAKMAADQSMNLGTAISKTFSQLGWWGFAAIGGITAAIGAATALAQKSVTKAKKQVAEISGATDSGQTAELETIELTQFKRVAPGMLTYADGNYPVLGSDGEVYDAKRVDKWQTKIYRSPHYGILGEKGPELIVDGVTTNKMMTQRPDLYREIINLAKSQSMQRVRTYADGNYPTLPSSYANAAAANQSADYMQMMQQQLRANNEIMAMLSAQLANGITISALGDNGAVNRLNENQDWMRRHRL